MKQTRITFSFLTQLDYLKESKSISLFYLLLIKYFNLKLLSIKILTYELAIRFLTDYINGDTYFKIKHKNHNKDRFMNQYILLKDIETKLDEINDYIEKTVNDLKN